MKQQYDKIWITWFNKNKTKNLYGEILNDNFPNHNKCKNCNGPIYYYDSTFSINKNNLFPLKKSYLSSKNVFVKTV